MKKEIYHYWTDEDHRDVESAGNFSQLLPIALRVIARMPRPISVVSGPISTGGQGSIEKNLIVFSKVIDHLSGEGHNIFHQLPFQDTMIKLGRAWPGKGYCMPILTDFYQPLYETGLIKKIHFIPGWKTSFGANWEHDMADKLGIEKIYLAEDFLAKINRLDKVRQPV